MDECILSVIVVRTDGSYRIHDLDTLVGSNKYTTADYDLLHRRIEDSLTDSVRLITSPFGLIKYSINNFYISLVYIVRRLNKCIMVLFNDRANKDWVDGLLNYDKIDNILSKESWIRVGNQNDLYT